MRWHHARPLRQVAIVKLSGLVRNNDFCLQMNDAEDLLNCRVKWPAAGDQWAEAERVRRTYTPGGQSPVVTQHRTIGGWRGSLDPDRTYVPNPGIRVNWYTEYSVKKFYFYHIMSSYSNNFGTWMPNVLLGANHYDSKQMFVSIYLDGKCTSWFAVFGLTLDWWYN